MASNAIVEVTDANFDSDVLKSDKPVLVDFWAAWCGPCRAIAPIVEELAGEYQGKVKVGKMDVDRNGATPMRYKVTGIPTLLIFKNGQVVEQLVGYRSKDDIQKALDRHVGVRSPRRLAVSRQLSVRTPEDAGVGSSSQASNPIPCSLATGYWQLNLSTSATRQSRVPESRPRPRAQ
jgi:thioredoxin 1